MQNQNTNSISVSDTLQQADAIRIFRAEQNISRVRSAIIFFNILVYYYGLNNSPGIPYMAFTISVIAAFYTLYIEIAQPYKKYPVFLAGYLTSISDCLLITLWLHATGGFHSPFYMLWYISIFAVAFRFSPRTTLVSSVLYSLCYLFLLYAGNSSLFTDQYPEIIIRVAYILFAGVLGSIMTRESIVQTHHNVELERLSKEAERANNELTIQTTLYENMLQAQSKLGEGVCLLKEDRLVYVNDALCQLYGYSKEELLSLESAAFLVSPDEHENMSVKTANRVNSEGVHAYRETMVTGKNGERIYIGYSSTVFMMNGEKNLFYIVRNVTERKKQEAELAEYNIKISNILESITDGFFALDKEWRVNYWNKEAEKILGLPREDIIGKNLWDLYQDAIPLKFYTEYHRSMREQASVQFEEYFPRLNMWFSVSAFPSSEGLSVYFKDITKDRNYVITIEEKNIRLREIAWTQSHVIRAPLARIMGLIDLLKNHSPEEECHSEILNYILTTAVDLDKIIREIVEKTEQADNTFKS